MTEGKDITIDDARALVADVVLWPRMRDFLWDFVPQVHESWLDGLGLGTLGARSPRVSRFILSSLGVEPCFHTFPKGDWSRLLLLDGSTIESVAKWIGALALSDQLRRVTDGQVVRELKSSLPGVYPEVFRFSEYFGRWKVGNVECNLEARVVCGLGCQAIFALLKTLPAAFLRRLELKLPRDFRVPDAEAPWSSQVSILNSQFIAKLLRLRFPEAYSLCC